MVRRNKEAERPAPPSGSMPTSARELNRERLLTPGDAADALCLSSSWMAKARMRGDGPPFLKIGRSIRYSESALAQWLKSNMRLSTSDR